MVFSVRITAKGGTVKFLKRQHHPDLPVANLFRLFTAPNEVLSVLNGEDDSRWVRNLSNAATLRATVLQAEARKASKSERLRALSAMNLRVVESDEDREIADKVGTEFREIAKLWIKCGKKIQVKSARELNGKIDSFLRQNLPVLSPVFPLGISFTTPDVTSPRKRMDHRLGWLCLCLVASTWSSDLFRCPRCEKFFPRKRTLCKRPSRDVVASAEEPMLKAKRRPINARQSIRICIEAAQLVLDELARLPREERPAPWEPFVADKVSRRPGVSKPITKWSITRWHNRGEINPPWEPHLRQKQ